MNYYKFVTLTLFSFLFVLVNTTTFAQDSFSGEVKMKISDADGKAFDMNYLVKENFIRFGTEMPGQSVGIIFNASKNNMLMIMEDQKMYMEFPLDMMYENSGMDESKSESNGKFFATGETKKIIGYTCEKWVYESDENIAETWMTKEIGKFKFFEGGFGKMQKVEEWQSSIEKSGFFPMLVINRDKSGKELNKMEVTSIDKKTLDDKLFTVPAGYQKFNMPNMR